MRNYNFTRPILIIGVAFLAKSLTKSISLLLGADPETADAISTGAMVIAALFAFTRLNRQKNKNQNNPKK